MDDSAPHDGGRPIVLTAPLTEIIDHAGYFIQMSMASLPIWLEGILNGSIRNGATSSTTPTARRDTCPPACGSLEASLLRRLPPEDIVCCYPADLHKFVGPRTRVVAVSTHNPLGVTFAAGVYTSIFGSSREPINSHYARELFATIKAKRIPRSVQGDRRRIGRMADRPDRQLRRARGRLCGRGPKRIDDTLELFEKALRGEPLPRQIEVQASEGSRTRSCSRTSGRHSASSK